MNTDVMVQRAYCGAVRVNGMEKSDNGAFGQPALQACKLVLRRKSNLSLLESLWKERHAKNTKVSLGKGQGMWFIIFLREGC